MPGEARLLTELAFGADAIAVADDEHPDHQLGIDRGPPDAAVMRLEFLLQVAKGRRHEYVDPEYNSAQVVCVTLIISGVDLEKHATVLIRRANSDEGAFEFPV